MTLAGDLDKPRECRQIAKSHAFYGGGGWGLQAGEWVTASPAGRPLRSLFRSSVPVFLRSEKGLYLAGMICCLLPRTDAASTLHLPRLALLFPTGPQTQMGRWPWHWGTCFSVAAGGQAWWGAWPPACPLLHRNCASLVPKAARKETMETMETGQKAHLAWPLSSHPPRTATLASLWGPPPAPSIIIPGYSFPTAISCRENDSFESPVLNC